MKKLFDIKFLKKHIVAVVALALVFAFSVVSVFAWTETISSLKIMTQGGKEGIIDSGINTSATINDSNTSINLDSYFSESGNVHLASCSSPNGKDFYFPIKSRVGSSASQYRKSNINDKNVNYISFSLHITADSADRTFYFRQTPTIKIGGTTVANTDTFVRTAFYLNNEIKGVFASSNTSAKPINSVSGDTTNLTVNSFNDYSIGHTSIFKVAKNTTATLTVSLWLEDPACKISSGVVSVEGLELITEAQQKNRYTFADCTSAFNAPNDEKQNSWLWVSNDNAVMWISDGSEAYKMNKVANTNTWIADVADRTYTTSTTITFYRTASTVTNPLTATAEKIYNKWTTNYQSDTSKRTYSAFGTADSSGNGMGTWDSLIQIKLKPESTVKAATDVLPIPADTETHKASHIYAIYKSGNQNVNVEMCYYNKLWRCYLPSSVTQISFKHNDTDKAAILSTLDQSSLSRGTETAYTVTGASTGYWGTGVLVKANVADNSKNFGKADVTVGNNSVNGLRVTKGTKVKFTATPNSGYQFMNWTAGSTANVNNPVEVAANSDLTYVANFAAYYNLVVHARLVNTDTDSTTGGTVKLKNGGTDGVTATYKDKKGTTVTLTDVFTATPKTNYVVDNWYDASGNVITKATLNSETTNVYVKFKPKTVTITAHSQVNGEDTDSTYGGTVKLNSGTGGATAKYYAESGSTVTLDSMFDVVYDLNYKFDGWFDSSGKAVDKNTQIKVSDATTNYYAKFTQIKVTIYFDKNKNTSWNNTPYIYIWDNNYSGNKWKDAWPGVAMTADSGMYKLQIPLSENGKTYTNVIFNNNSSPQTGNLTIPANTGYVKYVLSSSGNGITTYVKDESGNWIQK